MKIEIETEGQFLSIIKLYLFERIATIVEMQLYLKIMNNWIITLNALF